MLWRVTLGTAISDASPSACQSNLTPPSTPPRIMVSSVGGLTGGLLPRSSGQLAQGHRYRASAPLGRFFEIALPERGGVRRRKGDGPLRGFRSKAGHRAGASRL